MLAAILPIEATTATVDMGGCVALRKHFDRLFLVLFNISFVKLNQKQ